MPLREPFPELDEPLASTGAAGRRHPIGVAEAFAVDPPRVLR